MVYQVNMVLMNSQSNIELFFYQEHATLILRKLVVSWFYSLNKVYGGNFFYSPFHCTSYSTSSTVLKKSYVL